MDRRFLMVLGVSLLFALVVSAVFYQFMARGKKTKKVEVTETVEVVVATKALAAGLKIQAADLKVVKMPVAQVPKGSFKALPDVTDRSVMSNILPDEPVIEARLAPKGSGVGLSPSIPLGMRAVTVRVNDVVGVAGFVLPGMRVDVLITGEPPGGASRITRTVLQNIFVLSAGQTTQIDATGKPVNAPNVTVLVTPEQAEVLTLSGNEGRLQLVLRNAGDQGVATASGASLSQIYGVKEPPPPAPVRRASAAPKPEKAAQAPPAPPADQVVLIRGTQKTVEGLPAPAKPESPEERIP